MNTALQYILKRMGLFLVTMLLVSFLTFLAFELVSGDPARTMLGTEATAEQIAALQHQMGLDQPFLLRYFRWLGGFFSGDLGTSYSYRQSVWSLISGKLELREGLDTALLNLKNTTILSYVKEGEKSVRIKIND